MCGIAGLIFLGATTTKTQVTCGYSEARKYFGAFKTMLLAMQSRGGDATGVILGNKAFRMGEEASIFVYKDGVPASRFFENHVGKKLFDTTSYSASPTMQLSSTDTLYIVGHTRGATSGSARDNRNNHPFICGNVVGLHNGIINNDDELKKSQKLETQGSCDSEVIFALLQSYLETFEGNYKQAIVSTAAQLSGWYTCVATDASDYRNLMLFRSHAPLSIVECEKDGAVLFCSGMDAIVKAISDNGLKDKTFREFDLPDGAGMVIDIYADATLETVVPFDMDNGVDMVDDSDDLVEEQAAKDVESNSTEEETVSIDAELPPEGGAAETAMSPDMRKEVYKSLGGTGGTGDVSDMVASNQRSYPEGLVSVVNSKTFLA